MTKVAMRVAFVERAVMMAVITTPIPVSTASSIVPQSKAAIMIGTFITANPYKRCRGHNMNPEEPCKTEAGNQPKNCLEVPPVMATGLVQEEITLEEAARRIQESICKRKACPKCGTVSGEEVYCRARADNRTEEIVLAISLHEVIGKLAGTKHKIYVQANTLFVRIKKGESI